MQVKHVIDYNADQLRKYHEATGEWNYSEGGFPQIAFYCFFTNQGTFRMHGFVAFDEQRAVWRKTKKEAVTAWENGRYPF